MNNISSSGVVARCNGKTYLTDMKNFSGTIVVDEYGNGEKLITEALMWYSVVVGEYIFFSNQKYNNYLSVYNTTTGKTSVLKEVPCKNITKHENYLYFIDEISKTVMKYSLKDGTLEKFSDSKTEVISISGDLLYYSSTTGIGVINIANKMEYAVLSSVAEMLGYWNNMLLYSDFKNDSVISVYQPSDNGFFRIDAVHTDSFVTYGNHIFAINRKENNSICRIDIAKGEIMRIYGEPVTMLHIAETDLYFLNSNCEWCKISVTGDGFTKIRIY